MKIVHVVRQFVPAVGGLETAVAELAQAQARKGHDLKVVTLNRLFKTDTAHTLPSVENWNGIRIERVPFVGSYKYPIAPSVTSKILDADVVHVHGVDFFADYLALTAPVHRRSLVLSTHGGFFHTRFAAKLKRAYFATVTRLSLTCYGAVAAVSQADFERFSSIRKHGMVCIENGADVAKFRGAGSIEPKTRMIYVGRIAHNKRLDRLLAFLQEVRRLDPGWTLLIAGRPWDVDIDGLKRQAAALGIFDGVEIMLSPDDTRIRDEMGRCSVLVSASEYEGFGITAVEGAAAGLLPVLSAIPPFRAIAERLGAGVMLNFEHARSAAVEFMAQWRRYSARYDENRDRVAAAAEQFSWDKAADAYIGLYEAARGTEFRDLLDVPIRVCTNDTAVELLDSRFDSGQSTMVTFANAHALNTAMANRQFREVLRGCVVLNDGIGADIASRILFGAPFPENLNGTDFTPRYLCRTRHRFRIFLLGGKPGVAARAANRLTEMCPRHAIVGCHSGYFPQDASERVLQGIRDKNPDLILVAMGNPQQELWLYDNLTKTGSRLGIAVGALFDFMAGEVPRAGALIRHARLEWLYRLCHEPSRLWRRYIIGNPVFLLRVIVQWSAGSRVVR